MNVKINFTENLKKMLVLSHRIRNPGSVPILKGLSSEMEGGIKVLPFLYHLPSHWAFPFIMDPQKNKCVPEKYS